MPPSTVTLGPQNTRARSSQERIVCCGYSPRKVAPTPSSRFNCSNSGAERAIADHDQTSLGPSLLNALHRAQQIIAAFVVNQPADIQHQVRIFLGDGKTWA